MTGRSTFRNLPLIAATSLRPEQGTIGALKQVLPGLGAGLERAKPGCDLAGEIGDRGGFGWPAPLLATGTAGFFGKHLERGR